MWQKEPSFSTKQLQSITVPTWIVIGEHDEAIQRSDAEYMAKNIPLSRLVIEPNAGHFVFLQYPEKFNQDVNQFLEIVH